MTYLGVCPYKREGSHASRFFLLPLLKAFMI